jgi:hypothetical protein
MTRGDLFQFVNGLHSGLPVCCVLFFIYRWPKMLASCFRDGRLHRPIIEMSRERDPDAPEYVRCDRCIKKDRRVEIKKNGYICKWLINKSSESSS